MRAAVVCAVLLLAAGAAEAQERIQIPGAQALAPYTPAVRANGFVFLSGVVPYDHAKRAFVGSDFETQVRQTLANLDAALKAAGVTRAQVVKTTVFLRDGAETQTMNKLYAEFFGRTLPARTVVPGVDWGRPELRIEIEAIAVDRR